jgi:hypothetical protein
MKTATRVEWEFSDVGAKVAVDVVTVERDRRNDQGSSSR